MRYLLLSSAICLYAAPASADDCGGFGFANEYLNLHFCDQFADIIGPVTRNLSSGDQRGVPDGIAPEWWDLREVREAHRVDPAKTLLLIQRIRDAGGFPPS